MTIDQIKSNGVHYTPPELAEFLASVVVENMRFDGAPFRVLDPACGDGALLYAFAQAIPEEFKATVSLVGYETDQNALNQARTLLQFAGVRSVELELQDFLTIAGADARKQLSLLEPARTAIHFDAIIANPPYVRTQVLGSKRSQELARQFDLSGRVDLYHAFAKAMSNVLKTGGTLGLLTSNRFLTIRSGAALRKLLAKEFSLRAIYDLGDTKLFSAAVLPVIVVGNKSKSTKASHCSFTRVYESRSDAAPDHIVGDTHSILEEIRQPEINGFVKTPSGAYRLERGALLRTGEDEIWSLSTPGYRDWLETIERHQSYTFDDVARIRVGIKTTADDVFIRDDWNSLPKEQRPEAELLRPLIRHFDANRWRWSEAHKDVVLYPHASEAGKRVTADLDKFPRGKKYLEVHFARLNRRHYVIDSGRKWYEIWVPHTPSEWAKPKIVFPDISEEPRFFFDGTGAVVNGDCYWMTLRDGVRVELLLLMLAVANSTFITRFYDIAFHNKLYSGRRRFMTQYVKKFPLPDPDGDCAQQIIRLVSSVVEDRAAATEVEPAIDTLVWKAFGLSKEISR